VGGREGEGALGAANNAAANSEEKNASRGTVAVAVVGVPASGVTVLGGRGRRGRAGRELGGESGGARRHEWRSFPQARRSCTRIPSTQRYLKHGDLARIGRKDGELVPST
jgi:hypothetical protein